MKRILLTNKYSGAALGIVKGEVPEGFEIEFLTEQTQAALECQIPGADYLLAGGRLKVSETVVKNAAKLKMIQRSGVGLDALDLDAIKGAGLPLYVNQGVNAQSVAEHALLLMLASLRRLTEINSNTHNGIWKKQEQGVKTAELRGKTIGLIGMGNIAKTVVSLLKPFGVEILYYNIVREDEAYEKANSMHFVSMDELFRNADIISAHCALTPETKGLICAGTIRTMKDGVVIINTARGEIVNAGDVAEALKTGKIGFAALDVHESEPIPEDYPLKKVNNVILTPHIAGVTENSFRAMMHDAFRNIALFEEGGMEAIAPYKYL